jgi:hypothetical protein
MRTTRSTPRRMYRVTLGFSTSTFSQATNARYRTGIAQNVRKRVSRIWLSRMTPTMSAT